VKDESDNAGMCVGTQQGPVQTASDEVREVRKSWNCLSVEPAMTSLQAAETAKKHLYLVLK